MDTLGEFGPHTVEKTFNNYKGRRDGILKALTDDVDELRKQCDECLIPENEHLCLYSFPCGKWEVIRSSNVPTSYPHSRIYKRPREEKDKAVWLRQVAADCDTWLFSVTFFFCGWYSSDASYRQRLFDKMSNLNTMYEVVTCNDKNQEVATENAKKQVKDKSTVSYRSSKKSKSNSEVQGMSSSKLVSTCKVLNSAKVTSDIGYKPIKDLNREGKKAITKRELPMQSAVQTRSKALGIQTRAQTGKSPIKKLGIQTRAQTGKSPIKKTS